VIGSDQTLIAGLIEFGDVVATLAYNGKVARDQRHDERRHDREALRVALIEELKINRRSLKENSGRITRKPSEKGGDLLVPTDPMDGAYRSFLPRIGLLSRR